MVPSDIHEPPNKPLEWTGPHPLSVPPPQAPCLPLRGSVRRIAKRLPSPGIHDWWTGVVVTGTRAIVYENEHMALGAIGPALARVKLDRTKLLDQQVLESQ